MPLIRDHKGRIKCVTVAEAKYLLTNNPVQRDYEGKIIKPGFEPITDQAKAREEYLAEVNEAAQKQVEAEAAEMVKREQAGMTMAKGLAKAFGLDKPAGRKKGE